MHVDYIIFFEDLVSHFLELSNLDILKEFGECDDNTHWRCF